MGIKYCKGHGWQVLAGETVTVETARECNGCTVREQRVELFHFDMGDVEIQVELEDRDVIAYTSGQEVLRITDYAGDPGDSWAIESILRPALVA